MKKLLKENLKKKKKIKENSKKLKAEKQTTTNSTSTQTKKIPRHEDLTDAERLAYRIKRQQRIQNKKFKEAQALVRPRLNRKKSLEDFGEFAEITSKAFARLTLKVMSLQTAFNYAEAMVASDIEADGVEWDVSSALKTAEKIQAILTTQIMLKHFAVPKALSDLIIHQTIIKQFGLPMPSAIAPVATNNNANVTSFTSADVKKVLEQFGKDISTGKP